MTFQKLALYLEKLEQTSSRLALIDILVDLFKEVNSPQEIALISYLAQGRVAPFYEPVEIGMSEKLVAQAIARAYEIEREKVLEEYGRIGDLGKVAEKLKSQNSNLKTITHNKAKLGPSGAKLSVQEVFNSLLEIARASGAGTVEKRVSILSDLLKKIDGVSAKHLVRIPLGTSRLGVGDPTILDAFAKAKLGDKSKRKLLEGAYNRVSDLGLIGQTLWKGGLSAVERLKVTVGRPIRSELAERLPTAEKIVEKLGTVNAQRKIDGFRVQIHKDGDKVRLFSRNLEETTPMFPEIVQAAKVQIKARTAILDAEAIGYNPSSGEFLPFQETTQRRRKYHIAEMAQKIPLKAFIFDILYKNGQSLIDQPLTDRLQVLKKTVSAGNTLVIEEGVEVRDKDKLQLLMDQSITDGLEGLVVKRPDSKYEAGARNFNWVKLKRHSDGELKDTIDCVILGYIFGRGKRAEFGAGALLVGLYDNKKDEFVTVSKIGTGLTDEEWREIHRRADRIKVDQKPARVRAILTPSVWIKPQIVIEVLADEITRSPIHTAGKNDSEPGYALRFPRLVKFREADKKAEDATTVKELIEMYKQQGHVHVS
ncbi:ATP-dependent DNA ligase [Candidatus Microgenomates bacterium]|nr:ATP-dependent DNA ligase [Candidatus Microgenomates bacterium]